MPVNSTTAPPDQGVWGGGGGGGVCGGRYKVLWDDVG